MRIPRDPSAMLRGAYDSELQALTDKARTLKERRIRQLGELVIACGADALTAEQLAGALLATREADTTMKEAWRVRGAGFFQRKPSDADGARAKRGSAAANDGGTAPA